MVSAVPAELYSDLREEVSSGFEPIFPTHIPCEFGDGGKLSVPGFAISILLCFWRGLAPMIRIRTLWVPFSRQRGLGLAPVSLLQVCHLSLGDQGAKGTHACKNCVVTEVAVVDSR